MFKKNLLKNGFSLIEMILVITIMGIMVSATLPLLDTKKIKMNAAEKLANNIMMVQQANQNHYIGVKDTNGKNRFGFMTPPSTNESSLINTGYLDSTIVNPFYNSPFTESVIRDADGNDLSYQISFNVPKSYSGMFKLLLPQVSISNVDAKTDQITSTTIVPGMEADYNNLMHRDSAAPQELRTSHGTILIHDNVDSSKSKLVVTDSNANPNSLILTNGNVDTTKPSLTVGDLGSGRYGLKGVGGTSDLSLEAANITSGGTIKQGYVQLGIFESLGVQAGANSKIRTLTNDNDFLVSSYKNSASPQWITKIGDSPDGTKSGQLWMSQTNQDNVLARVSALSGQVASVDSFAVKKTSDGNWNGASSWNNSLNDLDKNNVAIKMSVAKKSGLGTDRGVLTINDEGTETGVISKSKNFKALDMYGQIMHIGVYNNGDQIVGTAILGKPCAVSEDGSSNGIYRAIIFGVDNFAYTGLTSPTQVGQNYHDRDWNGFNAYIDNSGNLKCQSLQNDAWRTSNTICKATIGIICSSN